MITFHPYALDLSRPLSLAKGPGLFVRRGLLLHDPVTGGWGDAAPLPGFSKESLQNLLEFSEDPLSGLRRFPSGRFALECLRRPVGGRMPPVPVNYLWAPASEALEDFLERVGDAKAPCIKIKLGPDPDLAPVLALTDRLKGARIRLDPNRRWSLAVALEVFRRIPPGVLDYIEEPLTDPGDYAALWANAPVPVALDESLIEGVSPDIYEHACVKALVIKPTLMGDEADRAPWQVLAEQSGKELVWSSSFESGVGLWHLAGLAAERGGSPSGLDTGRVFETDLVDPRPLPVSGWVHCSGWRVCGVNP